MKSLAKNKKKEVSTIAVIDGDKILLGKRSDNGLWTNPGGHVDEGEHPDDAAVRELKEEAGLTGKPKHVVSEDVTSYTGKKMKIHAYVINHDGKQKPSSKNDPDREVKEWKWISTRDGLPEDIKENLHSPKNVVLRHLGLIKGLSSTGEGSRGGVVVGHTSGGDPIYQSAKKRKPGKLTADDQWSIHSSMHSRDGEKGEHGYTCDHCGKNVKNLVMMNHPNHGIVTVGEDCAEALAEGSAQTRLTEHFENKKKESREKKKTEKKNIKLKAEARKEFDKIVARAVDRYEYRGPNSAGVLPRHAIHDEAEKILREKQYFERVEGHGSLSMFPLRFTAELNDSLKQMEKEQVKFLRELDLGERKKSFLYIDLKKGMGGFKYIRKFKRGSKWVYVYKEPDQHARHISEEAIEHIRQLAELGDEHARRMHDGIEEISKDKLSSLRELADLGDKDAHKHLKEHFGIDRKQEKLEEQLAPAQFAPRDKIYDELPTEKRERALRAIYDAADQAVFGHLRQHMNSEFARRMPGGLEEYKKSVARSIENEKSLGGMLEKLHEALKPMDAAHAGLRSSNSSVQSAGSYGNHAYNTAIQKLVVAQLLPREYAEEHKRTANDDTHKVLGLGEVERKKREREEQERREMAELGNSMAYHMASIGSGRVDRQKVIELDRAIKHVFGKSLKKEEWPYHFEGTGLKTKITSLRVSSSGFEVSMQVYDKDGNPMMEDWSRSFSKGEDGRPHIYNSIMRVDPASRGGVQIGNLINQGQRKLMKSMPNGGTVGVTAALGVGGYNWANQGFSFERRGELEQYRDNFERFLADKGIHLTKEDLKKFTQPVHFAAFTDGKKYLKTIDSPIRLSPQQIQSKSLSGVEGEHPLTQEEISSGKSRRMLVHLGKLFLLGRSWKGIWDSKKENAATKYADRYYDLRDKASKLLEPEYLDIQQRARSGARSQPVERPAPVPRSSVAGVSSGESQRLIQWWTRGPSVPGKPSPRIRITPKRLRRLQRMPDNELRHFHDNANITSSARSQVKELLRGRGISV